MLNEKKTKYKSECYKDYQLKEKVEYMEMFVLGW